VLPLARHALICGGLNARNQPNNAFEMEVELNARNPIQYVSNLAVGSIDTKKNKKKNRSFTDRCENIQAIITSQILGA